MPPRKRKTSSSAVRGPVAVLFMIVVVIIYMFQEWQGSGTQDVTPDVPRSGVTRSIPQAQRPAEDGAIAVFFTDPLSQASSGGIENELVNAIDQAQKTIDVAIYNISLPNVTDALIAAFERGVMVRMVMESEAMDGKSAERLRVAGIDMAGDNREGLMHHKFVIIDSQEVWMGSLNFTISGAYNDFNNLVRIRSTRVAQNYSVEFNEMFVEGLFGPKGRVNTPYPQVNVNGIALENYFSPDDGVTAQIVSEIGQASQSIVFMAYSFTSDPIAEAMHQRSAAGVQVRGVFDESQNASNRGGEYDALKQAGYDVKLDGISGLQHSKVMIIDGKTVITGSFNFSASAENNNDENIIIIHDAGLAGQYLQAFEPVYASGK